MAMYNFGVGNLFIKNNDSNAVGSAPVQVGVIKDISLDISFDTKELRGSYSFPVDIARAGGKISGKAKFAQISGTLINKIVGGTQSTGQKIGNSNQVSSIPASSPYTITVANTTNWSDLGVYNQTTGVFMTRVASSPATGQYSASAGVYTFASADSGNSVAISYSYTTTAGSTNLLTNELMGSGTTYILEVYNTYKGKNVGVKLHAVTLGKYALAMKNEDFTDQDVDFMAFADSTGNVISLYTTE